MTTDIAHSLILIIPFHGIFLSILFIIKSQKILNPNFLLGLLLLVLSSLTLFQLTYLQSEFTALYVSHYYFLFELLIIPFLFLYNSIMIQQVVPVRIFFHLLIITLSLLLFLLIWFISGPLYFILAFIFIIINGLYLLGSVRLIIDLLTTLDSRWKHLRIPEYSWIIAFNLLVFSMFVISIFFYITFPVRTIYLAQSLKALVIYYIYYRIMNKVDFTN